jgi:hypothetical protein
MARLTSVRDHKTGVVTRIHTTDLLARLQIAPATYDGWVAGARKLRDELMAARAELNRLIDVLEEALDVFDPLSLPEPTRPAKRRPRKRAK